MNNRSVFFRRDSAFLLDPEDEIDELNEYLSTKQERSDLYSEYLISDHWSSLREKCIQRDGFMCVHCGGKGGLQVHHKTYARRGNEKLTDLITLCESCHQKEHKR